MTQKRWDEMSEEEREMIWTSDLTDDERRDMGVPKYTTLANGLRIRNWSSEEDEREFFRRATPTATGSPLLSREPRALQKNRLRSRAALTRSPDVNSVAAAGPRPRHTPMVVNGWNHLEGIELWPTRRTRSSSRTSSGSDGGLNRPPSSSR